jgi:hypothetical protein
MKIIPYSVLAATLLGGTAAGSAATQMDPPGTMASQEDTKAKAEKLEAIPAADLGALPAGTTICAELDKSIDAKKAKPGNEIVARTTLAVLWQGKIAIPNQAKIVGHVTEAAALSGSDAKSRLGILFDHVVMKDGTSVPIAMTVQAIGMRPVSPKDLNTDLGETPETHQPMYHAAGNPGPGEPNYPPPGRVQRAPDEAPLGKEAHVLDAGSHGVIGIPDVSLTEAKDAGSAAMIESAKRNVKMESETEIVLRVIAADDGKAGKP